jgi:diguanylate cyclase (GGDEF)-like protein/PAS domain S-box-containing protein
MDLVGSQRFPQWLIRASSAGGAALVLYSAYSLPFARVGLPLLLLALSSAVLSLKFSGHPPHDRRHVPVTEFFIILALMLFGNEAAVLAGALTVACTSLASSRSTGSVLLRFAITVITTAVFLLALHLGFGPASALQQEGFSLSFVNSACVALLAQAVIHASIVAYSVPVPAGRSAVSNWFNCFFWRTLSVSAACLVATLAAPVIFWAGVGNSMAVCAFAALAGVAYSAYATNPSLCAARAREQEKLERAAGGDMERFRSAFDHAAIGMALVSSEGRWLQVNRSLCDILGHSERELLATDFLSITHPEDLGGALANIGHVLKGKSVTSQMEKRYVHKTGHVVWVHWSVSRARDAYTKSVHLIFQIQDITDRKRAEQRLHYDAFHDVLTGLPNRALFMDHLKLAIARAQRHREQIFAVLYLDLDRFKIVNDSLGHTIGDQLLTGIAERLTKNLRPGDTVARLGGDEFTILVEDIADEAEAIQIAERIQRELSLPFNLNGREVFTTISMGIAPSSTGYASAEDILRDADTAMYRAKTLGKSRYEIFDTAMHARALNLLQMETDMRRAVERQEFFLHYQPIVALDTFALRGFEALVRWQHPERGFISPMDFIPVAEETGLIQQIGEWVLREACREMQRWQTIFPNEHPLFISVNLSSKQFANNDLIERVASIMRETKIDPRTLKLEITESVVMENIDTATEMLKELRALGLQLSIDDFGTGYSSLSYLHRFPIDTLKIDRSFVTRMAANNENTEIVRTIVVLAQNLGMDVVAEGVETNEQLTILRTLGCEHGQGYFFSKPVNKTGAEKIISETYEANFISSASDIVKTPSKTVLVA